MKAKVFQEMLARARATRTSRNEATPEEMIRRKAAQTHHRLQSFKLEASEERKLLDQLKDLRETWRKLKVHAARQDPRRSHLLSSQPTTVADVQANSKQSFASPFYGHRLSLSETGALSYRTDHE